MYDPGGRMGEARNLSALPSVDKWVLMATCAYRSRHAIDTLYHPPANYGMKLFVDDPKSSVRITSPSENFGPACA